MGPLGWRAGREQTAAHREIRQGATSNCSRPAAREGEAISSGRCSEGKLGWIILITAKFARYRF